jgi:hypothetical protein
MREGSSRADNPLNPTFPSEKVGISTWKRSASLVLCARSGHLGNGFFYNHNELFSYHYGPTGSYAPVSEDLDGGSRNDDHQNDKPSLHENVPRAASQQQRNFHHAVLHHCVRERQRQ